jgi:hypothetical protein
VGATGEEKEKEKRSCIFVCQDLSRYLLTHITEVLKTVFKINTHLT